MTRLERKRLLTGLAFSSPWLIGLSIFLIYPLNHQRVGVEAPSLSVPAA